VLHEPWFVARPDASREDDGVLIIRALDIAENKGKSKCEMIKVIEEFIGVLLIVDG
jgi:carotenoid cleavage dioxygenase-like enzyme